MERERMTLSLTSEAIDIVTASATERKRGEWISNAIVSYARSTELSDKGALERLEAKLDRVLALLSKASLTNG